MRSLVCEAHFAPCVLVWLGSRRYSRVAGLHRPSIVCRAVWDANGGAGSPVLDIRVGRVFFLLFLLLLLLLFLLLFLFLFFLFLLFFLFFLFFLFLLFFLFSSSLPDLRLRLA
jgi:hypothetical protein